MKLLPEEPECFILRVCVVELRLGLRNSVKFNYKMYYVWQGSYLFYITSSTIKTYSLYVLNYSICLLRCCSKVRRVYYFPKSTVVTKWTWQPTEFSEKWRNSMVVRISVNNYLLQVSLEQGGENGPLAQLEEAMRLGRIKCWFEFNMGYNYLYDLHKLKLFRIFACTKMFNN